MWTSTVFNQNTVHLTVAPGWCLNLTEKQAGACGSLQILPGNSLSLTNLNVSLVFFSLSFSLELDLLGSIYPKCPCCY